MSQRSLGWVCLAQREFEPLKVRLPDTGEAALAELARRVAGLLAPDFSPSTARRDIRRNEEQEVGLGEYERTTEVLHGETSRGIRVTIVESYSSDAAGPSSSAVTSTVEALGLPAGTRFELRISWRPVPFRNAGLSVKAELASDEAKLQDAEAVLDGVFRDGQIAE